MNPLLRAILAVALAIAPRAFAVDATWLGGPGNYTEAINWNTAPVVPTNGQPGPADTYRVFVTGGSLTLDTDVTVNAFTLSTAQLGVVGAKTLTANSTIGAAASITAGTLQLAGTTQFTAAAANLYLSIDSGAEISNAGDFTQTRGGLGESGIVLDADAGPSGAIFRNTAAGTFTADMTAGDGSIGYGAARPDNQFLNAGTFTKTGGHDYAANVAFANSGSVQVQHGALHLNSGDGGSTSGTFAVSTGATLALSGNFALTSGALVNGNGTLLLKSGGIEFGSSSQLAVGTLQILSGTAALRTGSTLGATTLVMSGGVLALDIAHTFNGATFGAGGTISGTGNVNFAGNTTFGASNYVFDGTGPKTFAGTATFATGATSQYLNVNGGGAEVANTGTFTQQRSGAGENALILNADSSGGPSTFRNGTGGTFLANAAGGDLSVGYAAVNAGNRFINEGTFTKTGANNYDFNVALTNNGTMTIQTGTVRANVGGDATGAFSIAGGATLALNGAFTLGANATVSGAGTARVSGGTATFASGSSLSAAFLQVNGGTAAFLAGSSLGSTALAIQGGTLQLDIDHTFTGASFTAGGGISGSGKTAFAGTTTFDANSYSFGGTGVKAFTGTTTFNAGSVNQFFNVNGGATVTNSGTFTQARAGTGQSALVLNADLAGGASVFRNATGGSFTANMTSGAGSVTFGTAASSNVFANDGTFVKRGSADYSVNVAFANTGSVTVQQGLLALTAGDGGATSGSFLMQSNATLSANGGFTIGSGTTVTGAGTFLAAGGNTTFASGSNFSAANLRVTAGTLAFRVGSSLGSTTLALNGGTLELDIDHSFTGTTFGDGATVGGTGALTFAGTTNLTGVTLSVAGSGVKTFSGTTTFAPGATDEFFNLLGGASVTNTGTFTQTRPGVGTSGIVLASNGSGASTFRNAAGATFNASVTGGIATIGYGGLNAQNKFVNAGSLNKSGAGTYQINIPLDNSGTVLVSQGTLSVTAGMTNKSGTVLIDSGATFDLSENANPSTTGSLTHNGATLALGANSLTVTKDYQNANFGSGNAFNGRAQVTGTAKILADGDTALAFTGDVSNGAIRFGTVHVGDTVSAAYALQNTGAAGPQVRGAFQTTAGGAVITDSRLSGNGTLAGNFSPLASGQTGNSRTVTFTATTPGALAGQQMHVATNFDNVTLANLSITGAANYYAAPAWTGASNASLSKIDATHYTLAFGPALSGGTVLNAGLSLLNSLLDPVYQDALGGSFDTSGLVRFTLNGFTPFSSIAPGDSRTGLVVSLDPSSLANGTYTETLTFNPSSTNGSGSSNIAAVQLTLRAVVVPEPATAGLLALAALTLAAAAKARRRQNQR